MTKREIAIKNAEMAGYHGDTARWTRLLVESRVNRTALNSAWLRGATMKNLGVKCSCFHCKREAIAECTCTEEMLAHCGKRCTSFPHDRSTGDKERS